MDTSR